MLDEYLPGRSFLLTELLHQCPALILAKTANATGLRYAESPHDPRGLDLADTGQGFKQFGDFHLADHVIGRALFDDIGQA